MVPELVRQRALANGGAGQGWLDSLPGLVAELSGRWGVTVGEAMAGGSASFVAPAVDADGGACVLKIGMPLDFDDRDDFFQRSVLVHELADGQGCVRLLAHDAAARAMLLERLGSNLGELGQPLPELLANIAATLNRFWRPVAADVGLPTMVDQAQWLVDYIPRTWDELGRPCERAIIDRALDLCATGADRFVRQAAVLVHGDAHGWNTLDAGDGSYKFVDPEGLIAEREYDLAIAMREYNGPLLAGDTAGLVRERAEQLAAWCAVDPDRVWAWGFVERVSTGLANVRDFDDDEGVAFLEVARRCL